MHEEIKVVIIDDEEMWLKNLATSLDNFGYTIAGTADNFESAVTLLSKTEFDIVLLDINLNNNTNGGIELGKLVSKQYKKPFIFITASNTHTMMEAISIGPSAYLSKPVNPSSLVASLQIAISNFTNNNTLASTAASPDPGFFFVKHGAKYVKLNWADIVYLRSDNNYTVLFNATDKMEYLSRSTMSKTLNFIIPPDIKPSFIQVNPAEAVNISFIKEVSGEEIITPYKTFGLTEAYVADLEKAINVAD